MHTVLGGVLVAGMAPLTAMGNEIDESIGVSPGGTLHVDLDRGAVEVGSHDAPQVRIVGVARGWGAWSFEFDLLRQGNDVRLLGEMGEWGFWPFGGPRVTVRAWVPREYSVEIHTSGGRLVLAALTGRVAAETSGGRVELHGATGNVSLLTSGGLIEATGVQGSLRAETSGGAVRVADVAGGVQVQTSGGSVSIARVTGPVEARTSGGPIDVCEVTGPVDAMTSGGAVFTSFIGPPGGSLETSGGRVTVQFPGAAGTELDAQTLGGRVEIDHPIDVSSPSDDRGHLVGTINGGGARLRLRTSGGGIDVRAL